MTAADPDLVEVSVPPEQVKVGDLIVETGDQATAPAGVWDDDPTLVAVPVGEKRLNLLPRERLVAVRRRPPAPPAPADPLDELRAQVQATATLALTVADAQSAQGANVDRTRAKVADAAATLRAKGNR